MTHEGTFNLPLDPNEPRPVRPHDITISLMGAEAHLATIKLGRTKISEDGKWYAKATVTKGAALSEEFWEANAEKIVSYIENNLIRIIESEA